MRLLVVCRANVARSPLAEVMLADALADLGVEVASAGVQAAEGAPPARGSVELAADRGLDLAGHRSRPVSEPLVAGADLVLTMSENQRDTCARLLPGAGRRTFTLREFDRLTGGLTDLPSDSDPIATPLAALVEAAHQARPSASPPKQAEDVPDPIGKDWDHWYALADELDVLTGRLAARLYATWTAQRPG